VTGRLVASAAQRAGAAAVEYVAHRAEVADALAGMVEEGDLVVTMGAGDIALVAAELARALEARLADTP
jgi:UDP-N-acetylmuramate--alanine ligase